MAGREKGIFEKLNGSDTTKIVLRREATLKFHPHRRKESVRVRTPSLQQLQVMTDGLENEGVVGSSVRVVDTGGCVDDVPEVPKVKAEELPEREEVEGAEDLEEQQETSQPEREEEENKPEIPPPTKESVDEIPHDKLLEEKTITTELEEKTITTELEEQKSAINNGQLQEVPLHTLIDIPQDKVPDEPTTNGELGSETEEPKDKISCVKVLNVMVFLAFMVNYMLRVNLTIAIVDMISPNGTVSANDTTLIQTTRFPWNTYQKNLILGCFYWGYFLTELPGGRMSEVFGPRRVFGYTIGIASIVTFFTPYASIKFDYVGVVFLRVVIGFMLGVTFPAMQPIAAKWIPPKDRTKFVSNMMASSLGAAVTLPMCGYIISSFGWEAVFYVTGSLGILWTILWFLFVYDSPSQHPRITRAEKEYLEKSIGPSSTTRKAPKVPWVALLTSLPVWAIVITHSASVFGFFTFMNQMPTYMKVVLQMDIKKNGILSSFPYVGKYAMALLTSVIADYIRAKGKISTTAIRKLFTTFAVGVPGFLMIVQVYLGYSTFWTVAVFTLALTLNGAVTAGYLGNGLDIAPNFAGTIFGMANTLSSMGGFVSTYLVADITFENETYEQFQIVFWILAVTYFVGSVTYLLLGTGELQEWNGVVTETTQDVEMVEKQPLQNETVNEKA